MATWRVHKDAGGAILGLGYAAFTAGAGETVDEYTEPQQGIIDTYFGAQNTVRDALVELEKSDVTLLRCTESAIAFPTTWKTYRTSLREIAAGTAPGPLPAKPAYPVGS